MEMFVWCWIYDRRLLCGLNHGKALTIYLWLIPFIISCAVLPYALLSQYRDEGIVQHSECNLITEVRDRGEMLRILIYIQEAIIFLAILSSLGMSIRTRNISKRLIIVNR